MYKEYVTNDCSFHLKTASNQVMTDDQELTGWCPRHIPPSTPSHHPSTNCTAHPSVTEAEVTQETWRSEYGGETQQACPQTNPKPNTLFL